MTIRPALTTVKNRRANLIGAQFHYERALLATYNLGATWEQLAVATGLPIETVQRDVARGAKHAKELWPKWDWWHKHIPELLGADDGPRMELVDGPEP